MVLGSELYLNSTVAGEGHLQQGGDETAVGAVVAGCEHASGDELLDRRKCATQDVRVVHVGRLVSDLVEYLGQRRAAEAVLAVAEVDQEEASPSRQFEVGGHR